MRYDRTNWHALADESELPIARNNAGTKWSITMDELIH
jgi:hypothetical protein